MKNDVFTDQEIVRREKLKKYYELGVDPYGQKYDKTHNSNEIVSLLKDKTKEEIELLALNVRVAGRIMTIRRMGKASFLTIKDQYGLIQGYISVNLLSERDYEIFQLADLGDLVGLEGHMMLTRTGEITVRVEKYTHLTKSLRPLPEKFHGLVDIEERYRRRYVDLIVNDDSRKIALLRPKVIRTMQNYFDSLGFVEVETSVLTPILGGANAKPFTTHHNSLKKDFYLRIATELPLKKLMVGGIERVYEIGRLFRNEGISTRHNPEFTTVELYQAYGDLEDMRQICENVLREIAREVVGKLELPWGDKLINLEAPFRWVSMTELIKEKTGIDFNQEMSFEEALKHAKKHELKIEKHMTSVGYIINEFFEEVCEKDLIQPTFVHSYPLEVSPLSKKEKDERFVERFELFINGMEIANAFTELNDPIDQKERFLAQLEAKKLGDEEASEMDLDFLDALEYGMPPAGGIGIGIDRLVMFMMNQTSIREVILFPHMRDK